MEKRALGLIETVGLVAALEAADAAVKSANVTLVGYELSKGGGLVTIKLEGDVGAIHAAVQAGRTAAEQLNHVYSWKVIPRPHDELGPIILSEETVGVHKKGIADEPVATEDKEMAGMAEQIEIAAPSLAEEKKEPTCNLCNDFKCVRVKGEPKMKCIHYFNN